ncbi:MAG TPA: hypothetical protein VM598_04955 [Bdellovibrionota bacterium]|nr:hypothetical protein [Bdellovibrionota bacterium]
MTHPLSIGVVLAFLLSTVTAYGAEQSIGNLRQELGSKDPASILVVGRLICDLGTENNGQACSIKIEEDGTGRVFRLRSAESVMRLYFDGARRATVEGRADRDPTTIVVKGASRL